MTSETLMLLALPYSPALCGTVVQQGIEILKLNSFFNFEQAPYYKYDKGVNKSCQIYSDMFWQNL